jgi:hypothetical protein
VKNRSSVLVIGFHRIQVSLVKGGPLTFTAQDHTEFVDAFYRIAQDRANKIVILTGEGGNGKEFSNPFTREHGTRRI